MPLSLETSEWKQVPNPPLVVIRSTSQFHSDLQKSPPLPPPRSALYQIAHLGDDDDEPEFSSAMQLEEGETFFFAPRPLRNLVKVDEMESLSPIMACQVCAWSGV